MSPSPRFAASTVALEERSFLRPIAAFRGIEREDLGFRRRPRSFERHRRSELFFSFSVGQAPGAAARALSGIVAKNRKRRIREKPKMEPLGFVTQEIVHRVTESDFRVERSSRFVTRRNVFSDRREGISTLQHDLSKVSFART